MLHMKGPIFLQGYVSFKELSNKSNPLPCMFAEFIPGIEGSKGCNWNQTSSFIELNGNLKFWLQPSICVSNISRILPLFDKVFWKSSPTFWLSSRKTWKVQQKHEKIPQKLEKVHHIFEKVHQLFQGAVMLGIIKLYWNKW